jgi:hypothetical protein
VIQWWAEWLRGVRTDQEEALRSVRAEALRDAREAMAGHDAAVRFGGSVKKGLLLGTARSSAGKESEIRLAWGSEYAHGLVQGGTGSGKTSWVSSVIAQELAARRPVGVIDCKGDLFESVLRNAATANSTAASDHHAAPKRNLVILNPFGDHLVPLNVCRVLPGTTAETQAYEVTLALSRLFEAALGLHMENILRHLVILLIEAGLSLVEAPLVLSDEVLRGLLASRSTNRAVREFFLSAYPAVPHVSKDALLSRLQGLLLPENLRLMLGAEECVDFRAVLDRGDPLIVFLGKGAGIPEEQVEILGSLIFQLLLQATYGRGTGNGRPYLLALDEFVHLLSAPGLARRFETALTTVRSFGLSLMLIHHNFAQLPPALREIVLGNCDLLALFRTSARNAAAFGDILAETAAATGGFPDRMAIHQLPNRCFLWHDRRTLHPPILLRAPDLPERRDGTSLGERATQGVLALPRSTLRVQLDVRHRRLAELLRPSGSGAIPPADGAPTPPRRGRGRGRPSLG